MYFCLSKNVSTKLNLVFQLQHNQKKKKKLLIQNFTQANFCTFYSYKYYSDDHYTFKKYKIITLFCIRGGPNSKCILQNQTYRLEPGVFSVTVSINKMSEGNNSNRIKQSVSDQCQYNIKNNR